MIEKIQPPMHGTYDRRAQLIHDALLEGLQAEYGEKLAAIKRGSGQNLTFSWELPARVGVTISKSPGNADPMVWVRRNDPTGKTTPDSDWKNECAQRSLMDRCYDLAAIMEMIKGAVDYNRSRSLLHDENAGSMESELAGVEIPEGWEISRDAKTGLYTLRQLVALQGVRLENVKKAISFIGKMEKAALAAKKSGAAKKGDDPEVAQGDTPPEPPPVAPMGSHIRRIGSPATPAAPATSAEPTPPSPPIESVPEASPSDE